MGEYNKPVKTKCWEAFLIKNGCNFLRQDGSHHHWKCPNCFRTITFWGHKKEIPRFHTKTCLRTMGKTNKQLNDFIKKHC